MTCFLSLGVADNARDLRPFRAGSHTSQACRNNNRAGIQILPASPIIVCVQCVAGLCMGFTEDYVCRLCSVLVWGSMFFVD